MIRGVDPLLVIDGLVAVSASLIPLMPEFWVMAFRSQKPDWVALQFRRRRGGAARRQTSSLIPGLPRRKPLNWDFEFEDRENRSKLSPSLRLVNCDLE